MFRTRTARAAATALLISASAMLALAGCSANEPELQQNEAASMEQWQHDFERCLKEEGIENAGIPVNPDGSPIEGDEGEADLEAALQTCDNKVGPAPGGANPVTDEQLNEQLLTYAKCMREAGYDVPDPKSNGEGIIVQQNGGPEADPADVQRCTEEAGLEIQEQ